MGALVLAAALVAYNNLRPELPGATYVTVNLAVGVVLGAVGLWLLRSNPRELGIEGNNSSVAVKTGIATVVLVAPLYALALFEPSAQLIADERVAELSASQIAFQALVRIPLGTALFEEFAFRGVLFGVFSRRGLLFGAVASSVPFGLWHIRPVVEVIDANAPDTQASLVVVLVVCAVVVTALAGLGFCWLRTRGGGILAPTVLHAGVNSLSLVASAIAHARLA
jgi:membrane protease YdiL (CAAX protease family)